MVSSLKVYWTNRAKARLRDIEAEIELNKPLVAHEVVAKILKRSALEGEAPNVGHSVLGLETTELFEVLLRPYRIIYRIKLTQVDIITVLYFRQLLEKDLRAPLKMHFFRDSGVSSVLESSFTQCKLRFSGRRFLALTKKSLFLEVPLKTLRINQISWDHFAGNIS